jgi:hypothetical protein
MRARFVPVTATMPSFLNTLTPPKRKMKPFMTLRRASGLSVVHVKAKTPVHGEGEAAKTARLSSKYADLKPLFLRGLYDKNLARRVMDRSPMSYNTITLS